MNGLPPAGLRLRVLLDRLAPGIGATTARLWDSGPSGPHAAADATARYRAWLTTTHQVIRATVPLLAQATEESLRRTDPLSAVLAPYFAARIPEEHGHDAWILADYTATGADPAEVTAAPPPPAVARFAGAPAYWIRHAHPLALLGHVALLEWYPPPAEAAARIAARTGLPPDAFRTLTAHADLDTAHGEQLAGFLDALDLTEAQHRLLLTAAVAAANGLIDVLAPLLPGGPATRSSLEGPWPTPTVSPNSASTPTTSATSSSPSWSR